MRRPALSPEGEDGGTKAPGLPAASGRAADGPVSPAVAFSGGAVFCPKSFWGSQCEQEENTSFFLSFCCPSTFACSAVVLLSAGDNSGAVNE